MPRIVITRSAQRDFERLRQFFESKSPEVAKRAAKLIKEGIRSIEQFPEGHRPVPDMMFHRERIIEFGSSGYIVRYFYEPGKEEIIVLRMRHQRETED
jgi:plasmid stabilization system protein ParE